MATLPLKKESEDQRPDNLSLASEQDLRYYGWRVVLAACFGVMAGFGSLFVYTFALFVKPLGTQFGWNREQVSLGFGLAAISLGVCSPLLGHLLDRFGPRRVILPCMTIFGCAVASLALLRPHLWQFYSICVILGIVGNGAAHLAYARSISTWFEKRLGTALAFVMLGAGLGAMLLPLIGQAILGRYGWRTAYAALGGIALLLGVPLSWRYIVERGAPQSGSRPAIHSGLPWQEGLRSYPFWIVVAVLFVSSISMNGAITHLSPLLTDRGISAANAALSAALLGGSSVLARLGFGWLLDRFFGGRVAFLVTLTTASGIFLLSRASSMGIGAIAAVLIGVGASGEAAITPYLLTRYFGLRGFATLYGLTWTFYAAAGALGPIVLGRAFDLTGSYTHLLGILAATLCLAATLNLFLPAYPAARAYTELPPEPLADTSGR